MSSAALNRQHAAIYLALALTFFNFVGTAAARVVLTLYALELGAAATAGGIRGGRWASGRHWTKVRMVVRDGEDQSDVAKMHDRFSRKGVPT